MVDRRRVGGKERRSGGQKKRINNVPNRTHSSMLSKERVLNKISAQSVKYVIYEPSDPLSV